MTRPVHDVSKLPKWAQQEIDRLKRDLTDALDEIAAGPEDSDTFANPYSNAPRPLGKEPTIEFVLDNSDMFRTRVVRVRKDGDRLYVNGGDLLTIYPRSSNSLEIAVVQR